MLTKLSFQSLSGLEDRSSVSFRFDGQAMTVAPGMTVAAALLVSGVTAFRNTPLSGTPRAPYCMMGACFDCLVEIDGIANRQSCMVVVREAMEVRTQVGLRKVDTHGEVRDVS